MARLMTEEERRVKGLLPGEDDELGSVNQPNLSQQVSAAANATAAPKFSYTDARTGKTYTNLGDVATAARANPAAAVAGYGQRTNGLTGQPMSEPIAERFKRENAAAGGGVVASPTHVAGSGYSSEAPMRGYSADPNLRHNEQMAQSDALLGGAGAAQAWRYGQSQRNTDQLYLPSTPTLSAGAAAGLNAAPAAGTYVERNSVNGVLQNPFLAQPAAAVTPNPIYAAPTPGMTDQQIREQSAALVHDNAMTQRRLTGGTVPAAPGSQVQNQPMAPGTPQVQPDGFPAGVTRPSSFLQPGQAIVGNSMGMASGFIRDQQAANAPAPRPAAPQQPVSPFDAIARTFSGNLRQPSNGDNKRMFDMLNAKNMTPADRAALVDILPNLFPGVNLSKSDVYLRAKIQADSTKAEQAAKAQRYKDANANVAADNARADAALKASQGKMDASAKQKDEAAVKKEARQQHTDIATAYEKQIASLDKQIATAKADLLGRETAYNEAYSQWLLAKGSDGKETPDTQKWYAVMETIGPHREAKRDALKALEAKADDLEKKYTAHMGIVTDGQAAPTGGNGSQPQGQPLPVPSDKTQLKVGQVYTNAAGRAARWDGTQFQPE